MKYGLPYKGSKNKLAERIVRLLPKRNHLIDLFCGGCAVSHAALLIKKYEHIHINDVNWMCPTLFMDALAGKYNNDTRWISREDFFRLKDSDPYVAVVWSFGNNMRDYLYSKEIEPLKKAIHYAMFFSDYSLGKELGHDLSFIDPIHDIQKRYIAVKRYFARLGHFQQQSFEGGADASRTPYSELAAQPHTGGELLQTGDSRKTAQYLSEYHPLERSTGGVFQKKKYKRPSEIQHGECGNRLASLAIPRTTAEPTTQAGGGGKSCRLQAVCSTTPKWKYQRIA